MHSRQFILQTSEEYSVIYLLWVIVKYLQSYFCWKLFLPHALIVTDIWLHNLCFVIGWKQREFAYVKKQIFTVEKLREVNSRITCIRCEKWWFTIRKYRTFVSLWKYHISEFDCNKLFSGVYCINHMSWVNCNKLIFGVNCFKLIFGVLFINLLKINNCLILNLQI